MLDVKPTKTEEIFKYIRKIAATEDYAITFLAYTFSSYESDIIFTLLSPDVEHAGKFIREKIRTIDGVIDSFAQINPLNGQIIGDPVPLPIEYQAQLRDLASDYIVPIPSAFILGSIGLGIAGWKLRRRRI